MFRNPMIYLLSCCFLSTSALAANVDAYFDTVTGKLVIPHLKLNGEVYYATLTLTDAANLRFQADVSSLTAITPPVVAPAINASASAIVGTWTDSRGVDKMRINFKANGTYEHFEIAEDPNCVTGSESGSYVWEPSTGLLIATVGSDGNKECGLSHPRDRVPLRFFVDSTRMQILEKGRGFEPLQFELVRVGN
ncbi:MAG: hypothetical protein V4751_12615 [Pseudomonadota bacterium]